MTTDADQPTKPEKPVNRQTEHYWIKRIQNAKPGDLCAECGWPTLRKRVGRHGSCVGCSTCGTVMGTAR